MPGTFEICKAFPVRHIVLKMVFCSLITVRICTDLSACHASGGPREARLGGPLIGHKLDTDWQGRLVRINIMVTMQ